jgi:hypothetical protein
MCKLSSAGRGQMQTANCNFFQITYTASQHQCKLQIHPQINPLQANINANSSTEQINPLQSQHQSTAIIQIHYIFAPQIDVKTTK